MAPKLFIYAQSEDGTETTWLVDAYETAPDGSVRLFRGECKAPVMVLSAEDVAAHFIVLEWGSDLSGGYNAGNFEIDLETDEDGDCYLCATGLTTH